MLFFFPFDIAWLQSVFAAIADGSGRGSNPPPGKSRGYDFHTMEDWIKIAIITNHI